jgi:hypothetical protein
MSEIGNNLGFFHLGCTLWAWRFSTVHGNIAVFPATKEETVFSRNYTLWKEQFQNTKGVNRSRKSKKARQPNAQVKRGNRSNNDLQSTAHKTKDWAMRRPLKSSGEVLSLPCQRCHIDYVFLIYLFKCNIKIYYVTTVVVLYVLWHR